MSAVFWLLDTIIGLYMWVIIAQVVVSWLIAFSVINTHNRFVYMIVDALYRLTEPVLGRIRRVLPSMGGLDLSPVVAILVLMFLRILLRDTIIPLVY